jgi:hypothetical protein
MHALRFVFVFALLAGALGCEDDRPPSSTNTEPNRCRNIDRSILCMSGKSIECLDGETVATVDCADDETCFEGVGCRVCEPFAVVCEGNRITTCNAAGTMKQDGEQCDASIGEYCSPNGCVNLCAEALEQRAYVGCEYFPITLPNTRLSEVFEYAVVVANPQLVDANVRIEVGGAVWMQTTVGAGDVKSITLPWITPIFRATTSRLERQASYRITSNVPVVAYQFNALEYQSGAQFSYTNDASLLLPAHALTERYLGVSRPSLLVTQSNASGSSSIVSPGFLSITATHEGTTTVHVRFRAYTQAVTVEDVVMGPFVPGDEADFSLEQNDVLLLLSTIPDESACVNTFTESDGTATYCDTGPDYDLTGTEILASLPVAVFGGHDCDFVPYNRWACDHLEEQLFPLEAWDEEALFSVSQQFSREPNYLRVVSAEDDNTVSFTPAVSEPVVLARGAYFEFPVTGDVLVRGTKPILVAQFLVGQDFAGRGSSGTGTGDPSMALVAPSGQLRREYVFLTPRTYEDNFANITAPVNANVSLNGVPITSWQTSATSSYVSARVRVTGGRVHRLEGSMPFALQVYGYGRYTSYLYTGGLDLERISTPIF